MHNGRAYQAGCIEMGGLNVEIVYATCRFGAYSYVRFCKMTFWTIDGKISLMYTVQSILDVERSVIILD